MRSNVLPVASKKVDRHSARRNPAPVPLRGKNFVKYYMQLADELEVYDSSFKRARIASRTQGSVIAIRDAKRWSKLKRAAR